MKALFNISKLHSRRKELRNNATRQEVLLWSKLKHSQLGSKFRRQHSIGGFIADFYCPKKKLVIEIDGSEHLSEDAVAYDSQRTKFFEGLGITVVRFSNVDINTNLDAVISMIRLKL